MEVENIVKALKATTNAENQKEASDYLEKMSKMIGFPQVLLQLANNVELESTVRQAAVIYLKNVVHKAWVVDEDEKDTTLPISEQDKTPIRQAIIGSIVNAPEPIRVHLCSCVQFILRNDFPGAWPTLLEEILTLLHKPDGLSWLGALLVIHKLTKVFEYKRTNEKAPLVGFMKQVMPLLYQRLQTLAEDDSQEACILEKLILKIFYCLVQFSLNSEMLTVQDFGHWLELFLKVVERPTPDECNLLENEDEKEEVIWWRCKKWALKIIARVFERYGSKGQVDKIYAPFAEYYSSHFADRVLHTVLAVLNNYVHGIFVSQRVLHLVLSHISDAVSHAQAWLIVKPYFQDISKTVLFTVLQHSDADEEAWEEDPEEYIRMKYDVFDELHSPAAAAEQFLQAASRRKGVLQPVLEFVIGILSNTQADPREVDGALHMIGVLSSSLIKNKKYKRDVEKLIDAHITPRIEHPARFVRARACWVVKTASDAAFNTNRILTTIVATLVKRLNDPNEELPVKVEAALAIQCLMNDQEQKALPVVKPHVKVIIMEVLRLITKTHVDDLTPVVDSLLENFEEDVVPIAYDVAVELVTIFQKMTTGEEGEGMPTEDYTVTVMGVLSTLETILALVEEHPEILKRVEHVVRTAVVQIFESFASDFFEEALSLTQTLITADISPEMWDVYRMIYQTFCQEGAGFFSESLPALHTYLVVDTEAFLSAPERSQWLLEMCEKTMQDLDSEGGEEDHVHAAKLLECFMLQCQGRVDQYILPIMQLVMNRFQHKFEESLESLRPQLLVTLLSALYYNPDMFLQTVSQLQPYGPGTLDWIFHAVYDQQNHFEGVHNRKVVVFALCKMLQLPAEHRPPVIRENPKAVTTLCLKLFDGIQKCVKLQAENRDDSDSDSDDDSDGEDDKRNVNVDEIGDSEDDVDEGTLEYLEHLNRSNRKEKVEGDETEDFSESDDSEEFHHFQEETEVDSYVTPLDSDDSDFNVYVFFKEVVGRIESVDAELFHALTTFEDPEQQKELQQLVVLCDQQENLMRSKKLEQSGGYKFDTSGDVPKNFNFS